MKKVLSVFLALTMALAMCVTAVADDKPLAGTYDVKIWVAEAIVDLTKAQIDNYNATNEDGIVINPTIEADAAGR